MDKCHFEKNTVKSRLANDGRPIFANSQYVLKNILTNSPCYYIIHCRNRYVFKNTHIENKNTE